MKSKILIAAFVLAIISSFAFMSRKSENKTTTNLPVEETKHTQGFVLEDDVNW